MVGEILRREREKQGLSLADVADETSIREVYLEAIEKGSYADLPGDVYAKGFIRNYSKFLQIDGDSLLEQYDAERNIVKEIQPADMPAEAKAEPPKKSLFGRKDAGGRDGDGGYAPQKSGGSLFAAGDEYRHSLEREEKSGSRRFLMLLAVIAVFLVGVYVAFMDDGTGNGDKSRPVVKQEKAVKQERPVKQEPAAPQKVYDGVEISAKMLERCWLSVKVDGQPAFEGTIEKGKEMSWKGKESVDIRAGNAGGIQITFNGRDAGTMGEIGQIADRKFTREVSADNAGLNTSLQTEAGAPSGYTKESYQESRRDSVPVQTEAASQR